jgi:hypothetical protein
MYFRPDGAREQVSEIRRSLYRKIELDELYLTMCSLLRLTAEKPTLLEHEREIGKCSNKCISQRISDVRVWRHVAREPVDEFRSFWYQMTELDELYPTMCSLL